MLEQGAQTRLATRLAQRRDHDFLDELARGLFDDRDLERFLGAEVSEQAALGQAGLLGEPADREAGHADDRRELERSRQDRLPGFFSLAHAFRIERSFYLSMPDDSPHGQNRGSLVD